MDSTSQLEECPVLKPSLKDFRNFRKYTEYLHNNYSQHYAMVKVVPPEGWKCRSIPYEQALDNLVVSGPIEQNMFGKGGIYECLHIEKKSMNLNDYKKKVTPTDKLTIGKNAREVEDLVRLFSFYVYYLPKFWKNISFSPPLYGADVSGSLMDAAAGSWNLAKLDSLLKQATTIPLKGVNTTYLYIGSWKSSFCWHREDLDLPSINYLHLGRPKFWYGLPQNQTPILEEEVKKLFPEHFMKCPQYLRHKTTLINPYYLKQKRPELRLTRIQHNPGEFIVVFAGAYHSGFNFGFNIAEAVNFGTLSWLEHFAKAAHCQCHSDTVRLEKDLVLQNLLKSPYSNSHEVKQFESTFKISVSKRLEKQQKTVRIMKTKQISKIKKHDQNKQHISVVHPHRGRPAKGADRIIGNSTNNSKRIFDLRQPSERRMTSRMGTSLRQMYV